jgi:hypothetical protein
MKTIQIFPFFFPLVSSVSLCFPSLLTLARPCLERECFPRC